MKGIITKIKETIKKYRELIKYFFIGVITTILNYSVFNVLVDIAHIGMHISNIIAWFISVIFAYFTNKLFVFESKSLNPKILGKEFLSFGLARVFSLILEEIILYIFVDALNMNKRIIKLIANGVVIIVNYVLSKFIIFRKPKRNKN